jgi:protein-disulfide isomerase
MIGLIIIAALLVVGGLILLGSQNEPAAGPVDISRFPAKGAVDAPVTIVEYSDFGCSHCQDFVLNKVHLLDKEYIETGKVRYIVHPFYLGRPEIGLATEAAWCAADQNRYFDYQYALFENQGVNFNRTNLIDLAGSLGLDQDRLSQCLADRTHRTDVENARQAAVRQGINSTPTFFINNQLVEGNQPYEIFQGIIDQELTQ